MEDFAMGLSLIGRGQSINEGFRRGNCRGRGVPGTDFPRRRQHGQGLDVNRVRHQLPPMRRRLPHIRWIRRHRRE